MNIALNFPQDFDKKAIKRFLHWLIPNQHAINYVFKL